MSKIMAGMSLNGESLKFWARGLKETSGGDKAVSDVPSH